MRDKTTLTSKVMAPDGSLHDTAEFRRPATPAENEALNNLFGASGEVHEFLIAERVIEMEEETEGVRTYTIFQLPKGYKIVPSGS